MRKLSEEWQERRQASDRSKLDVEWDSATYNNAKGLWRQSTASFVRSGYNIKLRINVVDKNNWWISFIYLLLLDTYPIFWEANTCIVFVRLSSKAPLFHVYFYPRNIVFLSWHSHLFRHSPFSSGPCYITFHAYAVVICIGINPSTNIPQLSLKDGWTNL